MAEPIESMIGRAKYRAHLARTRRMQGQQRHQEHKNASKRQRRAAAEAAILRFARTAAPRLNIDSSSHALQVDLPDSVLDLVMAQLASNLEPGGVHGPSLVARDLANAALVCSEFYHSAKYGFSALSKAIQQGQLQQQLHKQPLPPAPSAYMSLDIRQQYNTSLSLSTGSNNLPGPMGWRLWDTVITDPLSLQLSELEQAARVLGNIPVTAAPAAAVGPPAPNEADPDYRPALDNPAKAAAAAGTAAPPAAAAAGGASPAARAAAGLRVDPAYKARLISQLLAAFGLQQPLPTAGDPTAAASDGNANAATSSAAAASAAAAAAAALPPQPPPCSAALLRALTLERCCPIIAWDGPDACRSLTAAVRELTALGCRDVTSAHLHNGVRGCLSKFRAELAAAGICSMLQLQQLLLRERSKAAERREREAAEKRQRAAAEKASKKAAAGRQQGKGGGFSLSTVSIRPKERDWSKIV